MAGNGGDVLGDEFEDILPSTASAAAPDESRPAEAAAPLGDEFEHILATGADGIEETPSVMDLAGAKGVASHVAAEIKADDASLHRQMLEKKAEQSSRYAEKVKAKRRARGRTEGDFSRQAAAAMTAVHITHTGPSHGSAAHLIDEAAAETREVQSELTKTKSVSDRRYADQVAKKRLKAGLDAGAFVSTHTYTHAAAVSFCDLRCDFIRAVFDSIARACV